MFGDTQNKRKLEETPSPERKSGTEDPKPPKKTVKQIIEQDTERHHYATRSRSQSGIPSMGDNTQQVETSPQLGVSSDRLTRSQSRSGTQGVLPPSSASPVIRLSSRAMPARPLPPKLQDRPSSSDIRAPKPTRPTDPLYPGRYYPGQQFPLERAEPLIFTNPQPYRGDSRAPSRLLNMPKYRKVGDLLDLCRQPLPFSMETDPERNTASQILLELDGLLKKEWERNSPQTNLEPLIQKLQQYKDTANTRQALSAPVREALDNIFSNLEEFIGTTEPDPSELLRPPDVLARLRPTPERRAKLLFEKKGGLPGIQDISPPQPLRRGATAQEMTRQLLGGDFHAIEQLLPPPLPRMGLPPIIPEPQFRQVPDRVMHQWTQAQQQELTRLYRSCASRKSRVAPDGLAHQLLIGSQGQVDRLRTNPDDQRTIRSLKRMIQRFYDDEVALANNVSEEDRLSVRIVLGELKEFFRQAEI